MKYTMEDIFDLLELYNPWWKDVCWYQHDQLIQNYKHSILQQKPRLYYHIKRYIVEKNCYGIITIRGPRRVGKSTLIKLIIDYLIREGIDPSNIFYIPLDYERLLEIPLLEILKTIVKNISGDKYIFLDEASMYRNWALVLKNIYDMGIIESGRLKIVATGSHSMDLAEAASKLRGRQGCLAKQFNVGGNLVHTPLRFPEVVEALREEINMYIIKNKLRYPRERFKILLQLAKGSIPNLFRDLYLDYFQLIQNTFENYLIHGGYPKAVNEFYSREYIEPEFYYDVAELLLSDCESIGLDKENLRRVLNYITNPKQISGLLGLTNSPITGRDQEGRPQSKFKLGEYLDYLRTTWSFFFSYPESKRECVPNLKENPKTYILDPFIYHALYSYLHNVPDPFNNSKRMVDDSSFRGLLVESTIASHLLLSQQLFEHVPSVTYSDILMYKRSKEGETDFILCISKFGEVHRFQIESKYRKTTTSVKPEGGKIVLTRNTMREKGGIVQIPVSLFLLLF